ncbi:MAG TPA: hypothetical protein VJC11_03135 [Patescibacteria group bacterium]|nr:hypothetical protein [Patescibacteria group bacterium]
MAENQESEKKFIGHCESCHMKLDISYVGQYCPHCKHAVVEKIQLLPRDQTKPMISL